MYSKGQTSKFFFFFFDIQKILNVVPFTKITTTFSNSTISSYNWFTFLYLVCYSLGRRSKRKQTASSDSEYGLSEVWTRISKSQFSPRVLPLNTSGGSFLLSRLETWEKVWRKFFQKKEAVQNLVYTRLKSFRLLLRMVSFTAAKIRRMFSVSVAHVKWE